MDDLMKWAATPIDGSAAKWISFALYAAVAVWGLIVARKLWQAPGGRSLVIGWAVTSIALLSMLSTGISPTPGRFLLLIGLLIAQVGSLRLARIEEPARVHSPAPSHARRSEKVA